jgi:hypothetical protein
MTHSKSVKGSINTPSKQIICSTNRVIGAKYDWISDEAMLVLLDLQHFIRLVLCSAIVVNNANSSAQLEESKFKN